MNQMVLDQSLLQELLGWMVEEGKVLHSTVNVKDHFSMTHMMRQERCVCFYYECHTSQLDIDASVMKSSVTCKADDGPCYASSMLLYP
jgi:hypothetical protein